MCLNAEDNNLEISVLNNIKYININSQLDATITNFIDNYNQLNMFRAIISPILRSTRLCLQLVIHSTDDAANRHDSNKPVPIRPRWRELAVPVL